MDVISANVAAVIDVRLLALNNRLDKLEGKLNDLLDTVHVLSTRQKNASVLTKTCRLEVPRSVAGQKFAGSAPTIEQLVNPVEEGGLSSEESRRILLHIDPGSAQKIDSLTDNELRATLLVNLGISHSQLISILFTNNK